MSEELQELYQEIILDHNRRPRNERLLEDATFTAEGYNPLCGDELTVFVRMENDLVADVTFKAQGCAISKASASMMTTLIRGKTKADALAEVEAVLGLINAAEDGEVDTSLEGDVLALRGVRKFPARIKCATLAWHALETALKGGAKVSTE